MHSFINIVLFAYRCLSKQRLVTGTYDALTPDTALAAMLLSKLPGPGTAPLCNCDCAQPNKS
jgi:hypothetical protein